MTKKRYPINYSALNETEKKKIQKTFHEDDLSYFSSFAIESGLISETDIKELRFKIDKRAGNSFLNSSGFAILSCIIFIGSTIFFTIYQSNKTHPAHYQILSDPILNKNNFAPLSMDETEPPTPIKSVYPKEHFSIQHSGEQITKAENNENMAVKEIAQLEVPSTSVAEEPELTYIPNAPVIFIKDLKVANYKIYYFKNNQSVDLTNNGVSAQFENKKETGNDLLSKINERNTYAHEIIKDALTDFSHKDYGNCLASLELLLNYNKTDVNSQFYSGMSYYYLGSYGKAQLFFDQTLNNDINVFQQEAEFYNALCLLNTKNYEAARQLLSVIAEKKMFYSERAINELEKLR